MALAAVGVEGFVRMEFHGRKPGGKRDLAQLDSRRERMSIRTWEPGRLAARMADTTPGLRTWTDVLRTWTGVSPAFEEIPLDVMGMLERLPEAVRDKIGFKATGQR